MVTRTSECPKSWAIVKASHPISAAIAARCRGLYAVTAYLDSQRTREIGIRLALGTTPRHILRLMMGHGMRLTL